MKGDIFQTQGYCGQAEVDASRSASGMIWMNLKPEGQLGNVFYAVNLVIGTRIVQPSGLAQQLGVGEAQGDVAGEEETRLLRYCFMYGTML